MKQSVVYNGNLIATNVQYHTVGEIRCNSVICPNCYSRYIIKSEYVTIDNMVGNWFFHSNKHKCKKGNNENLH